MPIATEIGGAGIKITGSLRSPPPNFLGSSHRPIIPTCIASTSHNIIRTRQ